jgi:hypothetical protein
MNRCEVFRSIFSQTEVCENVHLHCSRMNACESLHTEALSSLGRRYPVMAIIGYFLIIFGIFALSNSSAQELISVPAEYVRELRLPGAMNHFQRPARILADNKIGEIYIADAGNDRIVILTQDGLYKFEFSTSEQCGAPSDIAVDSAGHIYVLGSNALGQGIFEYDYNGAYLRQFISDSLIETTKIGSIAFDNRGRLYAADSRGKRILRFSYNGLIDNEFAATADLTGNLLRDVSYGAMTINRDTIYLPVSSLGTVYCLDLEGNKIREIGYFGTQAGELNFPVAVAITPDGTVLVLDKHRYNVSCYTGDGQFLGEFGGKGVSPGWFYHPTWLAVDGNGLIYIGQIFNNKIQVCRMPGSIRERQVKIINNNAIQEKSLNGSDNRTGQILDNRSRKTTFAAINNNQHNGGFLHA